MKTNYAQIPPITQPKTKFQSSNRVKSVKKLCFNQYFHYLILCSGMYISVWRYPKSERNRIRNFFPIPNFSDTESDTFIDIIFFRYRIRYFFRNQIFSILNPKFFQYKICTIRNPILFPRPNFFDTEYETIKKIEKFRNREVSKPRSFETETSHSDEYM